MTSTQPSLRSAKDAHRSDMLGSTGHTTNDGGDGTSNSDEVEDWAGSASSRLATCSPMASEAVRPVDRMPATTAHCGRKDTTPPQPLPVVVVVVVVIVFVVVVGLYSMR